ncbi:hypothetical protein, partial [Vibrio vulnificus]
RNSVHCIRINQLQAVWFSERITQQSHRLIMKRVDHYQYKINKSSEELVHVLLLPTLSNITNLDLLPTGLANHNYV